MNTPATVVDVRDGSVQSRILIALGELRSGQRMTVRDICEAIGWDIGSKSSLGVHLRVLDEAGLIQQTRHTGISRTGQGYAFAYRLADRVVLQSIESTVAQMPLQIQDAA